jgi:hypothetical protein
MLIITDPVRPRLCFGSAARRCCSWPTFVFPRVFPRHAHLISSAFTTFPEPRAFLGYE